MAKRGAIVSLGFTISPGDPTNVDFYLNRCLNEECSGSNETYSVTKNIVFESVVIESQSVVPEVIPMDVTPKVCVPFFTTVRQVYSLTLLTSPYQFVATELGYVLLAFL